MGILGLRALKEVAISTIFTGCFEVFSTVSTVSCKGAVGKPKAESLWPRACGREPMAESLWPRAYGRKPKEGLYSRRLLGFESLYIRVLDHCRLGRSSE